jgi:hypothetical protein
MGRVGVPLISTALILGPVPYFAADATNAAGLASNVIGVKGESKFLGEAAIIAKRKPSLAIVSLMVCTACLSLAGIPVSPALCIPCGILVSKTRIMVSISIRLLDAS